jgi:hypothetical protein
VKRLALALSAGILLLALMPSSALAVAVVDQSNPSSNVSNYAVGNSSELAQTFTAGKTGLMTEVQLYMRYTGSITVKIEATTAGGLPDHSAVPLATSAPVSPTSSPDWVTFLFGSPAAVTAGEQYAIVFVTGNTVGAGGSIDTYAGGEAMVYLGGAWIPTAIFQDFIFQTFVDPQTTTTQWSIPQVVAGTSTPLTLTVTAVFPNDGDAATYGVGITDPLPTWFTPTGVTCSDQISPSQCTLAIFFPANHFEPALNGDNNTFWFTLTGTASPARSGWLERRWPACTGWG